VFHFASLSLHRADATIDRHARRGTFELEQPPVALAAFDALALLALGLLPFFLARGWPVQVVDVCHCALHLGARCHTLPHSVNNFLTFIF
jgi:hypothetical protein